MPARPGPDLFARALARPRPARPPDPLAEGAAPAAVLLPVELRPGGWVVHALVRAATLRDHAGEVGFPGGKPEPGDADLRQAALRELEEEVGVGPDQVTVVGSLVPVPVITGRYLIHPYVGVLHPGVVPRATSSEVARLVELPAAGYLSGAAPHAAVNATWRGGGVLLPFFRLEGAVLYGASAFIFFELLSRVAEELGVELPPPELVGELPWGDRYPQR